MQYITNVLKKKNKTFITIIVIALMVVGSVVAAQFLPLSGKKSAKKASVSATPTAFLMEVYDTIEKNYWKDISEKRLTNFYIRGVRKLTDYTINSAKEQSQLRAGLENVISKMDTQKQRRFPAELADLVLKSLPPQGRSRL